MRDQLHGRANTEPEIAAHHFTQAGLTMPAVEWWGKAGELALRRCAYTEAIAHLETALQLADGLDRSDQRTYRLRLQITYGNVLRVARGFGVQKRKQLLSRRPALRPTSRMYPSVCQHITDCGAEAFCAEI